MLIQTTRIKFRTYTPGSPVHKVNRDCRCQEKVPNHPQQFALSNMRTRRLSAANCPTDNSNGGVFFFDVVHA
jgi:hypothetical protein